MGTLGNTLEFNEKTKELRGLLLTHIGVKTEIPMECWHFWSS